MFEMGRMESARLGRRRIRVDPLMLPSISEALKVSRCGRPTL